MATVINNKPRGPQSRSNASDMLSQWRAEYTTLEEKHADLERDYWQLQGQYSELQNQHRQILRLLTPGRSS